MKALKVCGALLILAAVGVVLYGWVNDCTDTAGIFIYCGFN